MRFDCQQNQQRGKKNAGQAQRDAGSRLQLQQEQRKPDRAGESCLAVPGSSMFNLYR